MKQYEKCNKIYANRFDICECGNILKQLCTENGTITHPNYTITSNNQNVNSNLNLVHCPKCGSTQIQAVNKKWSPLTGFLTNKVDRVCLKCKSKF